MSENPYGPVPPNQPPVGPPAYQPMGQAMGQPNGAWPQPHPNATLVLILGLLGLLACGVVAPFAWVMGNKARKEVRANPAYVEDTTLKAGRVLGIVGSVLLVVSLLITAAAFALIFAFAEELENPDCTYSSTPGAYSPNPSGTSPAGSCFDQDQRFDSPTPVEPQRS